jgi:hypothetical protein
MPRLYDVTLVELADLLSERTGPARVTFTATTSFDSSMNKKGNPSYGKISKVATVMATVNYNRSMMVDRRQARELADALGLDWRDALQGLVERGEDYNSQSHQRSWGTRVGETALVVHNDDVYVSCRRWKARSRLVWTEDRRRLSRDEVTALQPYLKTSRGDDPHRDYKITNISRLNLKVRVVGRRRSVLRRYRVSNTAQDRADLKLLAAALREHAVA